MRSGFSPAALLFLGFLFRGFCVRRLATLHSFPRQNALWAVVISRQVLGNFPVWSPAGAQPDQGQNLRNMGRNSEFRNSGLPTPGNLGTEMGPTGTGVWVRLVSPYGVQYRPIWRLWESPGDSHGDENGTIFPHFSHRRLKTLKTLFIQGMSGNS